MTSTQFLAVMEEDLNMDIITVNECIQRHQERNQGAIVRNGRLLGFEDANGQPIEIFA